jgi:hypothetical protein
MGSGAKSYMRKGFLIYEEMRQFFPIYEEAVSHTYMTLHPISLYFLIYEETFLFFFISVCLEASGLQQSVHLQHDFFKTFVFNVKADLYSFYHRCS